MRDEIIGERFLYDRRTGRMIKSLGPMFAEDWPYQDLPDTQPLLRYMDLWKFEDLLKTSTLYFCRADKFTDPLEGTISKEGVHKTSKSDFALLDRLDIAEISYQQMANYRNIAKGVTFVNCWHVNNEQCQQMWESYTNSSDSILLITSVGLLKHSLKRNVMMSMVKYVDENTPRTEFDLRSLFFYKDDSYAYEREYRLIVDLHDLNEGKSGIRFDDPNDFYRRIPVNVNTLVYGVNPHPDASNHTLKKLDQLVDEYLPNLKYVSK